MRNDVKETINIASAYEAMLNEDKEDIRVKYLTYEGKPFKLQRKKIISTDKQKPWTLRTINTDGLDISIAPNEWEGVVEVVNGETDEYHFTDANQQSWKITSGTVGTTFENSKDPKQKVVIPQATMKIFFA